MEYSELKSSKMPQVRAVQSQSYPTRYSLFPCLRPQTVAEHVGRCVQLAVLCIDEIKWAHPTPVDGFGGHFHTQRMLQWLCAVALHDLTESITGDIPYPVVHFSPAAAPLAEMQGELEDLLFPVDQGWFYSRSHRRLTENSEFQKDELGLEFLKIIDYAELVLYVTEEVELGNVRMLTLLKNATMSLAGHYATFKPSLQIVKQILDAAQEVIEKLDSPPSVWTRVIHHGPEEI